MSAPGYWKNGTWHGLSPLDPNKEALASCIAVEGVDVYVGGRCKTASGTFFGYWKNGFWRELMNTRQDLEYGTVIRLAVSGTDVEAAVWFKFSYHPRGDIRVWRNDAWKSLGSFDKEEGERIRATVVFGRDVYVPFNLSDSKTFSPCYLKNRDKVPLEIPDPAADGWVYSMTVVGK